MLRRKKRAGAAAILALAFLSACSLASQVELLAGLGKPCATDADCQNAQCSQSKVLASTDSGICTLACSATSSCPMGTTCAGGLCQVAAHVSITLPASVTLTSPTDFPTYLLVKSHIDGIDKAAAGLPYVALEQQFAPFSGNSIDALRALAMRSDVLIGHSVEFLPNLNLLAREFPATAFLAVNNGTYYQFFDRQPNLATVWVRHEEAWFIAGRLAGTGALSRLGIISTTLSPESVRNVNAFTLGARQANPSIKVEVRYIGATADTGSMPTYDYRNSLGAVVAPKLYREELLARQLVDSGCEYIADMSSNQRALNILSATVNPARKLAGQKVVPVLLSSSASGCTLASGQLEATTCLAIIQDNWEFAYQTAIESFHRGRLPAGSAVEAAMTNDANSAVRVAVNTTFPNALNYDSLVGDFTDQLVIRPAGKRIFVGPFGTSGQRDADGDGLPDAAQQQPSGVAISEAESATMCFYVDGVVEYYDTGQLNAMMLPVLAERPALVPGGLVPGATSPESAVALPIPTDVLALPARQSANCRKNAAWIYRSNG